MKNRTKIFFLQPLAPPHPCFNHTPQLQCGEEKKGGGGKCKISSLFSSVQTDTEWEKRETKKEEEKKKNLVDCVCFCVSFFLDKKVGKGKEKQMINLQETFISVPKKY